VGIAKERLHQEALQGKMGGELGAVVEGDGLAHRLRQGVEEAQEMACHAASVLAFEAIAQQHTGGSLMHGQDLLTVLGEHHQVGFPMARDLAIGGLERALLQ